MKGIHCSRDWHLEGSLIRVLPPPEINDRRFGLYSEFSTFGYTLSNNQWSLPRIVLISACLYGTLNTGCTGSSVSESDVKAPTGLPYSIPTLLFILWS